MAAIGACFWTQYEQILRNNPWINCEAAAVKRFNMAQEHPEHTTKMFLNCIYILEHVIIIKQKNVREKQNYIRYFSELSCTENN